MGGDWEWKRGGLSCRGEDLRGFSEDKNKREMIGNSGG